MINRRTFVAGLLVSLAGGASAAGVTVIDVYKTPTCGCCSAWVEHLRSNGFQVRVTNLNDVSPVAKKLGVPAGLRSCHTAKVRGYFIEGHVPAADVRKLLKDRPAVLGLAVPGMPIGAPGMEQGGWSESYDTVAVDRKGNPGLFVRHSARRG